MVPEHNLGIAILTNSDAHLLFDALKLEIIDAYLGLPFRNYSKMGQSIYQFRTKQKQDDLDQTKQLVMSSTKPKLPITAYIGIYTNEISGDVSISSKNETLFMEFQHHPSLEGRMEFIEGTQFLCSYNQLIYGKVIIPFKVQDNEVKGMELSFDKIVEPHSYLFDKIK